MIIRHSSFIRPLPASLLLCSTLLLGACASTPPNKPAPTDTGLSPVVKHIDGAARGDTDDAQVAQLWSASEQARRSGQNATALKLVYEALELSPQNPMLWSRAAELQLEELEAALAESYATKSNAFAAEDDSTLLYRNWLIIEQARQMRGDLLGVRSAHKKVREYEYR